MLITPMLFVNWVCLEKWFTVKRQTFKLNLQFIKYSENSLSAIFRIFVILTVYTNLNSLLTNLDCSVQGTTKSNTQFHISNSSAILLNKLLELIGLKD